jgi:phage terminase large subunit
VALPADFVNPFEDFVTRYGDNWPLLVREVLGAEPDAKQEEVLLAVQRGERRISVVSGHGVGKTTVLAWCCVCMILTRFPQKTQCTAATSGQLFNALYAEVIKWINKLPQAVQDLLEVQSERIMLRIAPKESFIAFDTSRPEKPEALAGVHSDGWVLLIADEASGVPDLIFEAASGSMSGHNATTLLAGNGVRASGLFYDTHHKLRDTWRTIEISCVNHPRVSADFVADMRQRYGVDSNQFRVRVLGKFPLSDSDAIIPRALAEAALFRRVESTKVPRVWGVDCARGGGDKSALAKREGNTLPKPIETVDFNDTMSVAGWVKNEWDNTPEAERPEAIVIDVIGIGAGVTDRLTELDLPVIGVNVSETPSFKNAKVYKNLRAELWWKGLEVLEARACRLNDPELIEELVEVKKDFASDGRLLAESKKAMKKRGKKSPNRADAWLLTLIDDTALLGLSGGKYRRTDWKKPLTRTNKVVAA